MITGIFFSSPPIHPTEIFRPYVTTSRAPLFECDFYMHKSNSTYLSDIDVAQAKLLSTLFQRGYEYSRSRGQNVPYPALGGITCLFKRQILPYQKYRVVSRVLTWDEKWIWILSHFVDDSSGKTGESTPFACCLGKVVWKEMGKTIPPTEAFRRAGLLSMLSQSDTDSVLKAGTDLFKECFDHEIEDQRLQGMEYAKYMLAMEPLLDKACLTDDI